MSERHTISLNEETRQHLLSSERESDLTLYATDEVKDWVRVEVRRCFMPAGLRRIIEVVDTLPRELPELKAKLEQLQEVCWEEGELSSQDAITSLGVTLPSVQDTDGSLLKLFDYLIGIQEFLSSDEEQRTEDYKSAWKKCPKMTDREKGQFSAYADRFEKVLNELTTMGYEVSVDNILTIDEVVGTDEKKIQVVFDNVLKRQQKIRHLFMKRLVPFAIISMLMMGLIYYINSSLQEARQESQQTEQKNLLSSVRSSFEQLDNRLNALGSGMGGSGTDEQYLLKNDFNDGVFYFIRGEKTTFDKAKASFGTVQSLFKSGYLAYQQLENFQWMKSQSGESQLHLIAEPHEPVVGVLRFPDHSVLKRSVKYGDEPMDVLFVSRSGEDLIAYINTSVGTRPIMFSFLDEGKCRFVVDDDVLEYDFQFLGKADFSVGSLPGQTLPEADRYRDKLIAHLETVMKEVLPKVVLPPLPSLSPQELRASMPDLPKSMADVLADPERYGALTIRESFYKELIVIFKNPDVEWRREQLREIAAQYYPHLGHSHDLDSNNTPYIFGIHALDSWFIKMCFELAPYHLSSLRRIFRPTSHEGGSRQYWSMERYKSIPEFHDIYNKSKTTGRQETHVYCLGKPGSVLPGSVYTFPENRTLNDVGLNRQLEEAGKKPYPSLHAHSYIDLEGHRKYTLFKVGFNTFVSKISDFKARFEAGDVLTLYKMYSQQLVPAVELQFVSHRGQTATFRIRDLEGRKDDKVFSMDFEGTDLIDIEILGTYFSGLVRSFYASQSLDFTWKDSRKRVDRFNVARYEAMIKQQISYVPVFRRDDGSFQLNVHDGMSQTEKIDQFYPGLSLFSYKKGEDEYLEIYFNGCPWGVIEIPSSGEKATLYLTDYSPISYLQNFRLASQEKLAFSKGDKNMHQVLGQLFNTHFR